MAEIREKPGRNPYPLNLVMAVFGAEEQTAVWPDGNVPEDLQIAVEYALLQLAPREQIALHARYQQCKTLLEVGYECGGVCSERARQIITRGLHKLRYPRFHTLLLYGMEAYVVEQQQKAVNRAVAEKEREIQSLKAQLRILQDEKKQHAVPTKDLEVLTVKDLDLSVRSYNALKNAGYNLAADVAREDPRKIYRLRNIGRKSYEEIMYKLQERGYEVDVTPMWRE